jgi:hypothetical protein
MCYMVSDVTMGIQTSFTYQYGRDPKGKDPVDRSQRKDEVASDRQDLTGQYRGKVRVPNMREHHDHHDTQTLERYSEEYQNHCEQRTEPAASQPSSLGPQRGSILLKA